MRKWMSLWFVLVTIVFACRSVKDAIGTRNATVHYLGYALVFAVTGFIELPSATTPMSRVRRILSLFLF